MGANISGMSYKINKITPFNNITLFNSITGTITITKFHPTCVHCPVRFITRIYDPGFLGHTDNWRDGLTA